MQALARYRVMESLFDDIQVTQTSSSSYEVKSDDPSLLTLVGMGTNTFPLLKAKLEQKTLDRKDAPLKARFSETLRLLSGHRDPAWHQIVRMQKIDLILKKMGPQADALTPYLLGKTRSADPWEPRAAIWALHTINTRPEETIHALVPLLASTNIDIAVHARMLIGLYTNHAHLIVPLLEKNLASTNYYHRVLSASVLEKFGHTNALFLMVAKELKVPNSPHKNDAVEFLTSAGTNASVAAPRLIQYAQTRATAAESNQLLAIVRQIDPEGKHPLP